MRPSGAHGEQQVQPDRPETVDMVVLIKRATGVCGMVRSNPFFTGPVSIDVQLCRRAFLLVGVLVRLDQQRIVGGLIRQPRSQHLLHLIGLHLVRVARAQGLCANDLQDFIQAFANAESRQCLGGHLVGAVAKYVHHRVDSIEPGALFRELELEVLGLGDALFWHIPRTELGKTTWSAAAPLSCSSAAAASSASSSYCCRYCTYQTARVAS